MPEFSLNLRQFQIQSVDFVGTDVAAKDGRVVGRDAAPPGTVQVFQVHQELGLGLTKLDATIARMASIYVVKVQILAVARPNRRANTTESGNPIGPLLRFEVVKNDPLIIR